MKNELMVFEGNSVEIFELNGQVLFNPRHVGECLDIDEVTVRRHIQDMSDKQVFKLTNESIVHLMNFRKLHNTGENFLTESGVYKLIFKSRKPSAEKFQDWVTDVVLPSIRKTGEFSMKPQAKTEAFELELIGIKYSSDILRMSEASRLGLLHKAYSIHGMDTKILPVYAEKKRVSFSATKLLEDRGKPMSAVLFNKLMMIDGLLEEKERPSSSGGVKKFKMLTEKGLEYGENLVSPKNEKEVQPYYFEDSFDVLLDKLKSDDEE